MDTPPEPTRRFSIRFTGPNKAMAVLGLRPSNSDVVVGPTEVTIRMGWAFRATIPLGAIASATADDDRVLGWGVHGWRGTWLVNGSSSRIVRIDVEPTVRGRVVGIPVTIRCVRVSVEDPDGLIDALDS